jgi:hypothetical protein
MTLPKSLESLAARRAQITDQFAALNDLRCGSITSTTGRCGKPNCRCHQPGAAGHGPNLRLSYINSNERPSLNFFPIHP